MFQTFAQLAVTSEVKIRQVLPHTRSLVTICGWTFLDRASDISGTRPGVLSIVHQILPSQVGVKKAAKEIRWLVHLCLPPLRGGEHVVLQQKLEFKMFEQRHCLGSHRIQKVVYRSYVLQGVGTAGHSFQTLRPPSKGVL